MVRDPNFIGKTGQQFAVHADEREPNNSHGSANILVPGSGVAGTFNNEDRDHFCIKIPPETRALVAWGSNAMQHPSGGLFVEPTIFRDVDNDSQLAQREIFGPVLAVIPFEDEADALQIANTSKYGLAAGVWTKDMARAFRMSKGLQSGTVWVNTYRALSFMAPFGGYKDSGLGRESGKEMIRSYMQAKTVWLNNSTQPPGNPFIMRLN